MRTARTRILTRVTLSICIRAILYTGNDRNNATHVRARATSPTCFSIPGTPFEFGDIENRGYLPCGMRKAPWRTCCEQKRLQWHSLPQQTFTPTMPSDLLWHQVRHQDVEEVIVRVRLRWLSAEYECPGKKTDKRCGLMRGERLERKVGD